MLPGKQYKPEDFVRIIRKRFWVVLVPFAIVACGAAGFGRLLPDMYRSQARIQYTPSSMPDARATTASLQERLRSTQESILSRTRLERLIKDFGLYPEEQKTMMMEEIAAKMRRDIVTSPPRGDVFVVSYEGRDPVTVMRVTENLARYFIDENLKDGQRRAEGNSAFFEAAVEEKRRQLLEIEDKLKQYKMRYAGELPSQMGANVGAVSGLQAQLGALSMSLNDDLIRRRDVERTISELETQTGPVAAPVALDPSALNGTAQQNLAAARTQLNLLIGRGVLKTHYNHQYWSRMVAMYEKEVNDQALTTPVSATAGLPPAEQARLKNLASFRQELETLKTRIAQKETQEKQLRQRAQEYQSKADQAPLRDAELVELTREYDTIKNIHNNLLASREAANITVDVQRRQIGEQFTLLDAAQVPQRPSSPDRTFINIFGAAIGLGIGLGLVVFLEYRDTSFKTDTEVTGVLALPVLAVVPLMMSDGERHSKFRRRLYLNLGLGSTVAFCLAALAYSILFLG